MCASFELFMLFSVDCFRFCESRYAACFLMFFCILFSDEKRAFPIAWTIIRKITVGTFVFRARRWYCWVVSCLLWFIVYLMVLWRMNLSYVTSQVSPFISWVLFAFRSKHEVDNKSKIMNNDLVEELQDLRRELNEKDEEIKVSELA